MKEYDLLVRDGRIVDGTGNPWFRADVGVKGDRIRRVGRIDPLQSEEIIDANGLVVSLGFMDPHNHSDWTLFPRRTADSFVHQGVTTTTIGNCGFSLAPISGKHFEDLRKYHEPFLITELSWNWRTFGEFIKELRTHEHL